MTQQSSGFLKGAVLASSVLLGAGFVAVRAGWVVIPSGADNPDPTFSSSKSTFIFVGKKDGESTILPPDTPTITVIPAETPVPITGTPLPPNFTIMAGSKTFTPLFPPKPTQQAATPPKK